MTKARTNASASPAVGRNMVINGAMNVSQRGTSSAGLGADGATYLLDRFKIQPNATAGRFTITQTADGPNGISANCLKLDCTTADTSIAAAEFMYLRHIFEGQNLQRIGKGLAGAKQITISFYVKASAAFTFGVELFDADNSRQITKLFATTTDWVRHSFVIPADEDDGSSPFADDNAESMAMNFWLHGGATYTSGTLNTAAWANYTQANRAAGIDSFFSSTDNNFFITGVQLEVGPVATEFEQEDISTTLAKCQRYYQKWLSDTAFDAFADCGMSNDTRAFWSWRISPTMRAEPTMLAVGTFEIQLQENNRDVTALPLINRATPDTIQMYADIGADNNEAGKIGFFRNKNDADAYIEFKAEL
jgi:hypothetical protein